MNVPARAGVAQGDVVKASGGVAKGVLNRIARACLLYTSDAADE